MNEVSFVITAIFTGLAGLVSSIAALVLALAALKKASRNRAAVRELRKDVQVLKGNGHTLGGTNGHPPPSA